ncbi:MAG TPA: putative manganese transporter [Paracoccaceae bacterium]|nr:putative manganese transporter [Paracoccaceae bacterium]
MTLRPDLTPSVPAETGRLASLADQLGPLRPRRLALALALLGLAALPGEIGMVSRAAMADAYVQVAAFVAATLALFYGAERLFRFDLGLLMRRHRLWQVPIAALMGILPGCGGSVFVVAAYSAGHVSLGAVVATLTATMGDAAFLLLATHPEVSAVLLPIQFATGIVTGYVVDALDSGKSYRTARHAACLPGTRIPELRRRDIAYLAIATPGLALGILNLAQIELGGLAGSLAEALALAGVATGFLIWSASPVQAVTANGDHPAARVSEETSFIATWVVLAYLAYEYAVLAGLDLRAAFAAVEPLLPLIAILVGFIPGCGPQVLTTTLYINGLLPFSALIGNAISNDGDALFPAIALNPRAAIVATAYSAVPALLIAYGFFFLAPDYLRLMP